MNRTRELRNRLAHHNEEGQLYVLLGVVSALVGWILVPILGLVAVACGYKLLVGDHYRLIGALVAVVGVVTLLDLLLMMATVL